jgi:hypothetical protein
VNQSGIYDLQEFSEEILDKNQLQAEKIYKELASQQGSNKLLETLPEKYHPLFSDPEIFIR